MASVDIFALTEGTIRLLSLLLHDTAAGLGVSLLLVLAASFIFREESRLPYLLSALLIALLLGLAFKAFLQVPRPCVLSPGIAPCSGDFSLPSMHSLLAFIPAIVSIGSRSFPLYLLYAIFVAWSRLYLGVHTPAEVAAGLALAFFACALSDLLWRHMRWKIPGTVRMKHDFRAGGW